MISAWVIFLTQILFSSAYAVDHESCENSVETVAFAELQTIADEEAFIRKCEENPLDDLPRLVFADWLDDHGQPERAEFIRIQIRLHSGDFRPRERSALVAREAKLLELHEQLWLPPEHQHLFPYFSRWERGFLVEFSYH